MVNTMSLRAARLLAVAVAVVVAVLAPSAAVAAPRPPGPVSPPAGMAAARPPVELSVAGNSADVSAAIQRDLKLSQEQAQSRRGDEQRAARVERNLRASLGDVFAGAWLNPGDRELTVAITDAGLAGTVRAAGARPTLFVHSGRQLTDAKKALDTHASSAPASVSGWYVDLRGNRVVVLAGAGDLAAANQFVAASGVDPRVVQVSPATGRYRTLVEVIGGDAYFTPQFRCSMGFSVYGGFVTAGHCGTAGTPVTINGVEQGTFQGSSFPGDDHAWVQTRSGVTPRGAVNRYDGHSGTIAVAGTDEAPVGAAVCRSGSTTGWRCGTIMEKDFTAHYAQGDVFGLTRTSACAEGGDSGGPFLWGNQAQGVLSGGAGTCADPQNAFSLFQPLPEILQTYGLTLITNDFVPVDSAAFQGFALVTGSFITLYTTFPVTDESLTFPFPWADQTPDGMTVSTDNCQPFGNHTLKIAFVGPSGFGGNQINVYYPNTYQGGRNVEPFTCDGGGPTVLTVHPKPGFGGDIRREVVMFAARPAMFMAAGGSPAGFHYNAATGDLTLISDCNANPARCRVATNDQQNFLIAFTTGGELYGCPDVDIPCTPPMSGLGFSLAPVGGGPVRQDLTFFGFAGFVGQEQANIRILPGTPAGEYRLRVESPPPLPRTDQQLVVRLGPPNRV
jgi:streptogrisin C